jgi:hypothetical protein
MAKISITDLNSSESKSFLISLKTGKSSLIKTAIQRSLDARQITGGFREHTCGVRTCDRE